MTRAEYEQLYKEAFDEVYNLSHESVNRIKDLYLKTADKLAEEIKKLKEGGYSSLTTEAMQGIENSLRLEVLYINESLDEEVKYIVQRGSSFVSGVDYLNVRDAMNAAGANLDEEKLARIFNGVDSQVVTSMMTRLYKDGYTFSQRVWKNGQQVQEALKEIMTQGIAEGRDIVDIAQDLQAYVKGGARALATRYGGFTAENWPEWIKRMPANLDYNALRLIRSELYAGLQQSAILSGAANPACLDQYEWKKNTSERWNCRCEEYERNSPYTIVTIPGYPHSNCLCSIKPILRNYNDYMSDLKRWVQGDSVDYLDRWYNQYYLFGA